MRSTIMLALVAAFALTGCVGQGPVRGIQGTGLIYSHTREPLMLNSNATKVSDGNGSSGSVKELQLQTVRVTWSENAIGEIAKDAGIRTVYYADIEIVRVLGIWSTQTVHIYGSADGDGIHLKVPVSKGITSPPQTAPN